MITVILIIVGLCLGSFVNALVWRIREQSSSKAKNKDLSILKGRSMCVHCKHKLTSKDLVPVISWLSLGGKCRYCGKSISVQYPVVEILVAILLVASYIFWPREFDSFNVVQFGLWGVLLTIFTALVVYDIRWMTLPDKLVRAAAGVALIIALVGIASDVTLNTVMAPFWGVLFIAGLFYVLYQMSGGKWIGGGDVKLGLSLGLLVGGPLNALLLIFLASTLGSVFGLPLLLKSKNKAKARIPFGPFLIAAAVIVFIFGTSLVGWYKDKLLYGF